MTDPNTCKIHYRLEIPIFEGGYRAEIHENGTEMYSGNPDGKGFFPDTWNENQIIDINNLILDIENVLISGDSKRIPDGQESYYEVTADEDIFLINT